MHGLIRYNKCCIRFFTPAIRAVLQVLIALNIKTTVLWNVNRVGWKGDTDVSENQIPLILAAEQDTGRYNPGYSETATVLLTAKKITRTK